jgi:hypothetical protein
MNPDFVHFLIAGSYETFTTPIRSGALSAVIRSKICQGFGEHRPLQIMTYQMPYLISPVKCGLKECWADFTDEEREGFAEQYPDLATAIALMCGDNDGKARSTSSTETGPVSG